jgi:glycosyltransferase involved in cell wall biosynthesis
MRIGQNPAKSVHKVAKPRMITVAIISYIPFLSGYYAQALDVLKTSLTSLRVNTSEVFDLLIFDNGSDETVRNYLQSEYAKGDIQYLVLSEMNIGKGGAWNFIFGAAPGEYLAYADGDIYFEQGWLSKSMQIMNSFPKVGMVTGRPLRSNESYYSSTLDWAEQTGEAHLEKGQFLTWDVFNDHALSCGVSAEQSREWFHGSHDWKITYKGITAFAGAAHFQFLARKSVLQAMLPLEMERPMGQVRTLDEKLNADGFLRLMTEDPLVMHMGNTLGFVKVHQHHEKLDVKKSSGLFEWPPIKWGLMHLYDKIFQIYYGRVN